VQIHDCKGAVRFLRANAAKSGLDANAFGAWGSSAGGHLVALMGAAGDANELEGDVGGNVGVSSRVQAVCDFFGPTDFLAMKGLPSTIRHMSADSPESQLLGSPVTEVLDRARQASPVTYVSKDAPPFLIVHGDKDMLVPYQQSELLHAALTRAGVASELYIVKGGGHGGFSDPAVPEKVRSFFLKTLKGIVPAAGQKVPAATAPSAGGK
jgi:acetyl esterase/lipase